MSYIQQQNTGAPVRQVLLTSVVRDTSCLGMRMTYLVNVGEEYELTGSTESLAFGAANHNIQ